MSEILTQIKTYCMKLICAQTNSALDAAPDFITDMAEQTSYPEVRNLYIETIHELRYNDKSVAKKFEESISHAFDSLMGNLDSPNPVAMGGVDASHLFKASDLEEKLALETMSSKAKTRSELPLQSMVRSLNGLLGDDWVQNHGNPMDPEKVIKAWLAAMHVMQLHSSGNLAMYALFDTKVLYYLPTIYEKIGSYLEKLTKNRGSLSGLSKTDSSGEYDYEQDFGDIDNVIEMPDYASFSSYESGKSQNFDVNTASATRPVRNSNAEAKSELRTAALVSLLDKLQRNRELDNSEFYDVSYLMDLRNLLNSFDAVPGGVINPETIGVINDDVVDMTQLMFSFIMDDTQLPDDIRYHISHLQIPYLKLGLQDKSLFVDKDNPARQLLNDLAQAVNLWDPAHSGGLDLLLAETSAVVDKIIDEYHTDTKVFTLIRERFNRFVSGDKYIDEEMQHRQKDTASKTEKADNVKLHIESRLDAICQNKRIPPIVDKILEGFWTKVLFLEYLKAGQESEHFADYMKTAEMLVDSTQLKSSTKERKEMAKYLPKIVKQLKKGLETISVSSFETVDIFRELQECHMLVLRESSENTPAQDDFEVTEEEYREFKREQNIVRDWNRGELENALLEENIERSLGYNDSEPDVFDENKNVITAKKTQAGDATVIKAARERKIIDNELKEARDAYELALKEHKKEKAQRSSGSDNGDPVPNSTDDADEFMMHFFQDPDYLEKQYSGKHDLSQANDSHLTNKSDDIDVEDTIFNTLEEKNEELIKPPGTVDNNPFDNFDAIDEKIDRAVATDTGNRELEAHSNDELTSRAHGALEEEFNELGEDKVFELIEHLRVGLWVDLLQADGSQVRAKIMAIVPTLGKYIFGDRNGHKILDFNHRGLAEALRTGVIRVREQDNVFDKTLESVISNLRVMKNAKDE